MPSRVGWDGVPAPSLLRSLGLNYGRGALMGAADVVPGVSGGTVALIVGIYERLIRSIRAAAGVPVALLRADLPGTRSRLRAVDWGLVVPLAAGILTAIVVGAAIIPGLMDRFPEGMRAVFFGLIVGSLVLPWSRIGEHSVRMYAVSGAAALLAFVLVGLPARDLSDPMLAYVFVCAMIAICAMILPGVSGAFLLLVFGIYQPTMEAVRSVDLVYIVVFAAGAALGLGLFARLLDTLLARRHDITMAALVGLMVGALRALWPWLDADRGLLAPPLEASALGIVALALVAFALVTALLAVARRRGSPAQRLPTEPLK